MLLDRQNCSFFTRAIKQSRARASGRGHSVSKTMPETSPAVPSAVGARCVHHPMAHGMSEYSCREAMKLRSIHSPGVL